MLAREATSKVSGFEAADKTSSEPTAAAPKDSQADQVKAQQQTMNSVIEALHAAARELKHVQENIIKEHKEQIARLAVEIARKVLMQEIKEGDYKIESIIQEALNNAPTHQGIVVHLNPEDFAECQISEAEQDTEIFKDLKLLPDPNVGKAECLIETPKGVIESVIEEHLENISKALTNAE